MATERRAPEDLQEAVAATLRRLRGEIGQPGQAQAARQEPVLGPTLTGPGAPFVATPPAATPPPAQPDLLSRAETEHEIPPNPSLRLAELRQTLDRPDPTDRQRTILLPYMLSILALAVFAGIGWWAYRSVSGTSRSGEVPVVAASQVPEKVPPTADQAADTSTTSGDKTVYNEVAPGSAPEPKTEVLLPPPEAPQLPPSMDSTSTGSTAAPATTTPSATATDSGSGSAAATPTAGTTGSSTSADQAAASPGTTATNGTTTAATSSSSSAIAPATSAPATTSAATLAPSSSTAENTAATAGSGMTETLIPGASTSSGSASSEEPASVGAAMAPAATSTAGQSNAAPAAVTDALPAAPLTVESTAPATTAASTGSTNSSSASTAAAASAPATTSATTAAPAASAPASPTTTQTASLGNYRIQLASLKSEAAAQKTWKRLATKYKDVLASLTVHIQKVALASGTFYRLQAGPFEDKTAAAAVCAKLKVHGQPCLVKP